MLDAKISYSLSDLSHCVCFIIDNSIISVKTAMTSRKLAGVRNLSTSKALQRLHAKGFFICLTENTCKFKISGILPFYISDRAVVHISRISGAFNNPYFSFKRIYCSSCSTHNYTVKPLHPAWVSGFTDGEGCFIVSITKNENLNTGLHVQLFFQISLHNKDLKLMIKIKKFFGVGSINKLGKNFIQFRITSLKDLIVIIEHFEKFPLITEKHADFELFKKAFKLIEHKQHLTLEGLRKIVAIKASMNRGIYELKYEFPAVDYNRLIQFQFRGLR